MVDITARLGKDGDAETCTYDFGENLEEARKIFNDEQIFVNFRAQCVIGIQSHMRNEMRSTDDEGNDTPVTGKALQKSVTAWLPGIKKPTKSATERAKEQMAKLTPEQRSALLAEYA